MDDKNTNTVNLLLKQYGREGVIMDTLNDYLQQAYIGHRYAFALLILLATTAFGSAVEGLSRLIASKTRV